MSCEPARHEPKLPNHVLLNGGYGGLGDAGLRLGRPTGNLASDRGNLDGEGDLDAFLSTFEPGSSEVRLNRR